jgi:hypothetical protein
MQITTYRIITNRTSLLKKLLNQTRIELTKKSNQTELLLKSNLISNKL